MKNHAQRVSRYQSAGPTRSGPLATGERIVSNGEDERRNGRRRLFAQYLHLAYRRLNFRTCVSLLLLFTSSLSSIALVTDVHFLGRCALCFVVEKVANKCRDDGGGGHGGW
jgi:hypothetical protein